MSVGDPGDDADQRSAIFIFISEEGPNRKQIF